MIAIHFVSSTLISGWLISHCIFQFLSKTDISMHPPKRTMNNKVPRRDEDEINDRVNWSIYHFTPSLTPLCSSQFNCRLLQTQLTDTFCLCLKSESCQQSILTSWEWWQWQLCQFYHDFIHWAVASQIFPLPVSRLPIKECTFTYPMYVPLCL